VPRRERVVCETETVMLSSFDTNALTRLVFPAPEGAETTSSRAAMRAQRFTMHRARKVDACRKGDSISMMTSDVSALLGPCPFQADNVMARRINFYATGEFDRAALRREDVAWIRARLAERRRG